MHDATELSAPDCEAGSVTIKERHWTVRLFCDTVIPPMETSLLREGSYFVENTGGTPLCVFLEVSADGCVWARDSRGDVPCGHTCVLVGKYYGKYCRLHLFCPGSGSAEIRFIAQFFSSSRPEPRPSAEAAPVRRSGPPLPDFCRLK